MAVRKDEQVRKVRGDIFESNCSADMIRFGKNTGCRRVQALFEDQMSSEDVERA